MSKKPRVAINGFGRIGRLFLRQIFDKKGELEVAVINDLGDLNNLAYLLRYDSVYGEWDKEVEAGENFISIDGERVEFLSESNPEKLPWKDVDIDLVVEATGVFETYAKAAVHLRSGAKRVVITAPAKDEEGVENGKTVLMGINEDDLAKTSLTCNGSCTTNAAGAIIAVLDGEVGVEKAMLSTVHGYTATQSIVDAGVKGSDFRKGRAGAYNIIPSTTGAAIAVTRALPSLKDKFDGMAFRVPVIAGSIADITLVTKKETTVEEVNKYLREASKNPIWENVFTVTEEQVVSADIVGRPYGAIADLSFTRVVGGNLVKVLSWYDNEWGYVATLVKHTIESVKSIKLKVESDNK